MYGSAFFVATGFHGLHVIIGTIFLVVCMLRLLNNRMTCWRHLGYELAIWYWHFVDLVWLFLFRTIYLGGSLDGCLMLQQFYHTYEKDVVVGFEIEVLDTFCPKVLEVLALFNVEPTSSRPLYWLSEINGDKPTSQQIVRKQMLQQRLRLVQILQNGQLWHLSHTTRNVEMRLSPHTHSRCWQPQMRHLTSRALVPLHGANKDEEDKDRKASCLFGEEAEGLVAICFPHYHLVRVGGGGVSDDLGRSWELQKVNRDLISRNCGFLCDDLLAYPYVECPILSWEPVPTSSHFW